MFGMIVEGIMAPRRSMRRLLDMQLGGDAIVLIALLGYLIQAIFSVVMGITPADQRGSLTTHFVGLMLFFGSFFILSEMIYSVGKMAGGIGTRIQTFLALAWHALIMSFFWPVWPKLQVEQREVEGANNTVAVPQMAPDQAFLLVAIFAVWIWLLAQYVRELHGFRNTWNVLGALLMGIVGVSIALAVVGAMILGAA